MLIVVHAHLKEGSDTRNANAAFRETEARIESMIDQIRKPLAANPRAVAYKKDGETVVPAASLLNDVRYLMILRLIYRQHADHVNSIADA